MRNAFTILVFLALQITVSTAWADPKVTQPAQTPGLGLSSYRLLRGPSTVAQADDNLSGLTYAKQTDTLFLVLNKPTRILEITPSNLTTRSVVNLAGFNDTEDITTAGGNTFAVVEERRRTLCLFEINRETRAVPYLTARRYRIEAGGNNAGLEGVSYDASSKCFFITKEKEPRRIYAVTLPSPATTGTSLTVTQPWDAEENSFGLSDIAAVHFDPATGHLLLLSEESKCIVECTQDGTLIDRLWLKAGSAGLQATIPQPEGLTLDGQGRLYVCSEPNLLYVFSR